MNKIIINSDKKEGYISPELHGQFIEFLGNCIYDGIWVGEKSEIPNYNGLRKDVIDALKVLAPPIVRWPGGCYADTYHWKNGIGDRAKRPVVYNENFGTFEIDNNQFGTHEFMDFCDMIGAKPWFGVNVLSGSVNEMKEWIEYCNRSEETELALLRKKNGSERPFQVEYWGIGNEPWCGGGTMTPQMYAIEYRKYVTAMPLCDFHDAKSERRLKKIACGPDGNKPIERVNWTKDFFGEIGKYRYPQIDAYDIHFYNWNIKQRDKSDVIFDEESWYNVIDSCTEIETVIKEQYQIIQKEIKKFSKTEDICMRDEFQCDLIVGEWGNWHGSSFEKRPALYQQSTIRDAITSALTLDIFHKNCNYVKMACVAQTVNVLNSLILTEEGNTILTPNYDVFLMYKVHRGGQKINIVSNELDDTLYIFASEKNSRIYVNVVNTDLKNNKIIDFEFMQNVKVEKVDILKSDCMTAINTVNEPNRIRKSEGEIPLKEDGLFKYQAKAASISVICFEIIK